MANLERIVNVQISLQTAAITTLSFSDLMLFGPFTPKYDERVLVITSADELIEDYGVHTTDPLYIAALVAFSQIPTLPHIFIGNSMPLTEEELVGSEPESENGEPPEAVDANDIVAIMAAVAKENNDWYAVCDTRRVDADAIRLAQWVEGHQKLFITAMTDPDTLRPYATDTTSLAARLKIQNFFRTAWWYHPDPTQFPDVAICVRSFGKYPGGETWANQRLASVVYTRLGETASRNVAQKNGNTFEPFRNIAITQYGKVAGGEWIDVIRFRDWLVEEIKIRIFQQMIDNRIPYTDPGIAIIRSRLTQALDFGVTRGGIAPVEIDAEGNMIPSYTVSVPLSMSISPNNKANRILQDVYFTARLAGAIHVIEIKGVLTYESIAVGEAVA